MLKAIAGGGGRGIRPVHDIGELDAAFERASSEAQKAFGSADLYIEELVSGARHVEVQIIGDGTGEVSHLWDRECSLQRQRQKLIEIAPAFDLDTGLRDDLLAAAVSIGERAFYRGAGTIEFLVLPIVLSSWKRTLGCRWNTPSPRSDRPRSGFTPVVDIRRLNAERPGA